MDQRRTPIPKYDNKNQLIGYWSNDSFALQPGIAQISESNIGVRDDNVASGATDRYMSKLDNEYLEKLANEIGGLYVDGQSYRSVKKEMKKLPPSWKAPDQYYLQPILMFSCIIIFYLQIYIKSEYH